MRIPKWIIILSFLLNIIALGYLFFQGYRVYKDKIDQFEKYGGVSYYMKMNEVFNILPNDSNEIVFMGDSHIMLGQVQELFQNNHVKNRGIGGDVTKGIYYRLDEALESKPNKLFIEIGTNDVLREYSLDGILNYYKKIIEDTKQKSPSTKIYVISTFPSGWYVVGGEKRANVVVQELNNKLKALCAEQHVQYIDITSSLAKNGYILPQYY